MSNIKACIFDLDGTLTNTINAIAHFGNIALAAFGLPEIPVEDYKIYVGDGRDKLIHRMLGVYEMCIRDRLCGKYTDTLGIGVLCGCVLQPFFCLCFKEGLTISKNDLQINEQIRDNEIRVVSADGEQLGVMSAKDVYKRQALNSLLRRIAYEKTFEYFVCHE